MMKEGHNKFKVIDKSTKWGLG